MNRETQKPVDLHALLHAAHAAQARVEERLDGLNLSLPKLLALKALSDAGESLPLGQLAERLACVKSNITQLVDRLEADGFVSREHDARDRRTKLAVLTAAGRKACVEGMAVHEAAEREILDGLTREEARQLGSLLGKLGCRLDA